MDSIAVMIPLICRKVVLVTLFCIGCKSAKMSLMGFLWLVAVLVDLNFTTKALSAYVIFGEGIGWYDGLTLSTVRKRGDLLVSGIMFS